MHKLKALLPIVSSAGAAGTALWQRRHRLVIQRQFDTLANAGPALIRQDDEAGQAVYFNQPWLAFTGRRREELLGSGWLEDVHPDDRGLLAVAPSLAPSTVEYRLRRRDGEFRWMVEHTSRYQLAGDLPNGTLNTLTDISDHKHAESGLRLLAATGAIITSSLDVEQMLDRFSRNLTHTFADACAVYFFSDDQYQLRAVSTRDSENYAALEQQLRSHQWRFNRSSLVTRLQDEREPMLFDANRPADFRQFVAEIGLTDVEGIQTVALSALTVRGRFIGAMMMMTRLPTRRFDEQDVGVIRSLGQRVAVAVDNARLFAEVQAAEQRYRRFFSGIADAILVADASFLIRETNPAFDQMYGAHGQTTIGQSIIELLGLPETLIALLSDLSADRDWRGNLTLTRADGQAVPIEAWLGQMLVPEGRIVVAAIRDISERARFEDSRRKLLASVSHDLKNPLNSIKANAQLAIRQQRKGTLQPESAAEIFTRIDSLTNRMVSQIENLMDVALLESGTHLQLELSEVDLIVLVRTMVEQYQPTTTQHQLSVVTKLATLIVEVDPHRFERVIANLLTNAIKYSPNGGEIVIAIDAFTNDGVEWARVSITDSGIGIEPSDLVHLFDRIGRGRNVTQRFSGTGIGLVGVSQIVQQHGGQIEVESEVGKGSTFHIHVPVRSMLSGASGMETGTTTFSF